ncbi:MAG: RNA polymerase sigma factor [Verrucomicrobiota bacterium]
MWPEKLRQSEWFEAEVKPHEPALRGFLRNQFVDLSDIDDVLQETYKRILRMRETQTINSPKSLLFTIAKNESIDLFRKKRRSRVIPVAELEGLDVIDDTDTCEEVSRIDEAAIMLEAVRSLPERCQLIFKLRKFDQLSHKEIAERLDITIHTVESQLTKGLRRCRAYFKKRGLLE